MSAIADIVANVPHSTEAEQSLLGGLLIDNGALERIGELDAAAFFAASHRLIYTAIRNQAQLGRSWDVITIAETLEAHGKLDAVGGLPYIGSIAHAVPSSANIKLYANIVREHCTRRQIIAAAAELQELVSTKGDIAAAMDKAQAKLQAITDGVKSDEPVSLISVLQAHFDTLEHRLVGKNRSISTGLDDLDALLNGGWYRGQVVVLAARPSMGKTALSMHHAIHAAMAGCGVLYLSMEMVAGELADRAFASVGRINLSSLLTAKMDEQEWGCITAAACQMQDLPLYILDQSGLTFYQVAIQARRHKRKHGMDVLIVDYLQLMAGGADEKRHAQIEEITRNLKSLAKELDIVIILLSQLSRKTEESRRPKLSHLRDSGSIEQDADVVLFVHREEVDNPDTEYKNYADIHVAKNRQGALGRVGVTYIGHQVRFENFGGALPNWDEAPKQRARGFQ